MFQLKNKGGKLMRHEKERDHKCRGHFKHESKEGILDETFEHEPKMHKFNDKNRKY